MTFSRTPWVLGPILLLLLSSAEAAELPGIESIAAAARGGEAAIVEEALARHIAEGEASGLIALGDLMRHRPTPVGLRVIDSVNAARLYRAAMARTVVAETAALAKRRLGLLLINGGAGLPADPGHGLSLLREAAEAGDVMAALDLGKRLAGWDFEADAVEIEGIEPGTEKAVARQWLWRALEAGKGEAALHLAELNSVEPASDQTMSSADLGLYGLTLLKARAWSGAVAAASTIGQSLYHGLGVSADPSAAVPWLRQAADGGNDAAALLLAQIIGAGEGVEADRVEAGKIMIAMAERGSVKAAVSIGRSLIGAVPFSVDRDLALEWLERAARAGDQSALSALAQLYLTKGDFGLALAWAQDLIAASNADYGVNVILRVLNRTPEGPDRDQALAMTRDVTTLEGLSADLRSEASQALLRFGMSSADTRLALAGLRAAAHSGNAVAARALARHLEALSLAEATDALDVPDLFAADLPATAAGLASDTDIRTWARAEALRWRQRAAGLGDLESKIILIVRGELDDDARARLDFLLAESDATNVRALVAVAKEMKASKTDQIRNLRLAFKLFERAASLGDRWAMVETGRFYIWGLGATPYEPRTAIAWFKRAAEAGEPFAFHVLGEVYASGRGVPIDHQKAFEYYQTGFDYGELKSARRLSQAYLGGFGVAQDFDQGIRYMRIAAEGGNVFSMIELATLFLIGPADQRDFARAFDLLLRAARIGSHDAEFILGNMYEKGVHVAADLDLAIEYYERSARGGFPLPRSRAQALRQQRESQQEPPPVGEPGSAEAASDSHG